jgi:hypothetical protein
MFYRMISSLEPGGRECVFYLVVGKVERGWDWSYPWVALILHVGKPLIKFAALSDIVILR